MSIPQIMIDRIRPNPKNIRKDLGDVDELAASIVAVGLLQPLVVRPNVDGTYTLIDGHRRFFAAKKAGARALPCIAAKPTSGRDNQTELMLAAAMHKQLKPLEQARAFLDLRVRGLSVADIARRTGYSQGTVSARLALADLPEDAKQLVRAGELSVTDATQLARQVRRSKTGAVSNARPSWFNAAHPLASRVKASCHHADRRLVGDAGCGQCWEDTIRADERTQTLGGAA